MCDHARREMAMVVVERDDTGQATVWCDPCLVPIVKALNEGGIRTLASCCGHGRRPGSIALADGRELVVAPDSTTARRLSHAYPPINAPMETTRG